MCPIYGSNSFLEGYLKAKSKNSNRFKEGEKEHSSLKRHMTGVVRYYIFL